MVSVYDIIQRILYADESTVIVTWDTLHIILTLLIFIALIIFIWLSKLDRYIKDEWEQKDISDDCDIPKCIDADRSMFVQISVFANECPKYLGIHDIISRLSIDFTGTHGTTWPLPPHGRNPRGSPIFPRNCDLQALALPETPQQLLTVQTAAGGSCDAH